MIGFVAWQPFFVSSIIYKGGQVTVSYFIQVKKFYLLDIRDVPIWEFWILITFLSKSTDNE